MCVCVCVSVGGGGVGRGQGERKVYPGTGKFVFCMKKCLFNVKNFPYLDFSVCRPSFRF